jgi:hypothetical protein
MIQDLALVTVMFDYPADAKPLIYDNALKYFDEKDIHICRFNGLPADSSLYQKLYTYKITHLLPYIKEHILGKYKYMLFVDAKDTNFYKDPRTIVEEFLTFNKSIVFCAEKELWPETQYTHLYSEKVRSGQFKFLNSGIYIGYVEKIVEHLETILKNDYQSKIEDQSTWTIHYLLNSDIEIDSEGTLFFSTHRNKDLVTIVDDKVILKLSPYVVHDNGPFLEETVKVAHLI